MKKSEIIETIFSLYEIAENGKQIYNARCGDGWMYYTVFETVLNSYNAMAKSPVKAMGFIGYKDIDNRKWATQYFMAHNKSWLEAYKVILEVAIDKMNGNILR